MTAIVPSYIAKVSRAEKHLIDLEAEIARYAARKPYTVSESVQGKKKRKVRRLSMTEDVVNTDMPIIVADIIYNLRSSLDHLMSSIVPRDRRTHVMFPIFFQGVWEPGPEGENAERAKHRARWATCTAGVPDEAVAFLKSLQPPDDAGDDAELHRLAVINRLSNRDRHERLPVVAAGLRTVVLGWTTPQGGAQYGGGKAQHSGFFENEAEITGVPYRAMNVEIEGTPVVVIRTRKKDANIQIPGELAQGINMIRDHIIPRLMPYVPSDAAKHPHAHTPKDP